MQPATDEIQRELAMFQEATGATSNATTTEPTTVTLNQVHKHQMVAEWLSQGSITEVQLQATWNSIFAEEASGLSKALNFEQFLELLDRLEELLPDSNKKVENPITRTPCFAFGSNNVEQLRERCQNPTLVARKAFLPGFFRIFAGTSSKWGGGGVASLVNMAHIKQEISVGERGCIGSAVDLTEAEFQLLDRFEGIPASTAKAKEMPIDPFSSDPERNRYRRVYVELVSVDEVTNTERKERGIAYIRNSSSWEGFPSDRYLQACFNNLVPFWGPEIDGDGALHVFDEYGELRGKWTPSGTTGDYEGKGGKPVMVNGPGSSPAWPPSSDIVISDGAMLGPPSPASYLSQLAQVKAFAQGGSFQAPGLSPAALVPAPRVPVWVTLGMYEFADIDLLTSKFHTRVRVYYMWPADLHARGLGRLADRAVEEGEHIKLSKDEVAEVTHALDPLPLITVYNLEEETELDSLDMRVYSLGQGQTAIMANAMYGFTCKQHFTLEDFPFDVQELLLDVRIINSRLWDTVDLIVHAVQYQKACLDVAEYDACLPKCKHVNTHTTQVLFPLKRKAFDYLRNVVGIMLPLSLISVESMACSIDDISGRLGTVLTILLTAVAFKLILADKLPAVSYSTSIDIFIELNMAVLFLTSILCIIPEQVRYFFPGDQAEENAVIVNRALTVVSLFITIVGNLIWLFVSYHKAQTGRRGESRETNPVVVPLPGHANSNFTYFAFSNPPFVIDPNPQ